MAFKIDKNGNISMIQGDSGMITIRGFNTNKNMDVYFSVKDSNRKTVGDELCVKTNYSSYVIFNLSGDYTDLFTVKKDEPYAIYYYGLKVCDEENQREDTMLVATKDIGGLNTITVYPKKVEGIKS